jgi:hypothetical protein
VKQEEQEAEEGGAEAKERRGRRSRNKTIKGRGGRKEIEQRRSGGETKLGAAGIGEAGGTRS